MLEKTTWRLVKRHRSADLLALLIYMIATSLKDTVIDLVVSLNYYVTVMSILIRQIVGCCNNIIKFSDCLHFSPGCTMCCVWGW